MTAECKKRNSIINTSIPEEGSLHSPVSDGDVLIDNLSRQGSGKCLAYADKAIAKSTSSSLKR